MQNWMDKQEYKNWQVMQPCFIISWMKLKKAERLSWRNVNQTLKNIRNYLDFFISKQVFKIYLNKYICLAIIITDEI